MWELDFFTFTRNKFTIAKLDWLCFKKWLGPQWGDIFVIYLRSPKLDSSCSQQMQDVAVHSWSCGIFGNERGTLLPSVVDWTWLTAWHQPRCSISYPLSKSGQKGKAMEKLMTRDKGREVSYQLLSQANPDLNLGNLIYCQ